MCPALSVNVAVPWVGISPESFEFAIKNSNIFSNALEEV
jgi:hypothetical protein